MGTGRDVPRKRRSAREAEHLIRRRRTSEVAQWALADVKLKPFIYVYELPAEYNEAFKALPAGWHSDQYDCALPAPAQGRCPLQGQRVAAAAARTQPGCVSACHLLTRPPLKRKRFLRWRRRVY